MQNVYYFFGFLFMLNISFFGFLFLLNNLSVGLSNMHMNTKPMLMNHSQLHKIILDKKADSYVNTIYH